MEQLINFIVNALTHNENLVFATIVKERSSIPRGKGARMIFKENGDVMGSVGGGTLEARTIDDAKTVFQTKTAIAKTYHLNAADVSDLGMVCGGDADILIEYIESNETNRLLFEAIKKSIDNREKVYIITVLPDEEIAQSRYILLTRNGDVFSNTDARSEIMRLLENRNDYTDNDMLIAKIKSLNTFVDIIGGAGIVYIFGGGHCGAKLVPILHSVGFKTVLIDDREQFANKAAHPLADEVICGSFENITERLAIDNNSYFVIVTRGHAHDELVLAQALKTNAAYIGMIGSKTKRNAIYSSLLKNGYTQEQLERVYSPIGLSIGAQTPEEIAVSIAAEMIKVRAGIKGGHQ